MASYFPLARCIEGLKVLVESLFGVTFRQIPLAPGESWHPDVIKILLHHPNEVIFFIEYLYSLCTGSYISHQTDFSF